MTDQQKLRSTLKAIAETTLPGEPITDPFWKNKMIERGEYNIERDCFTPNVGTLAVYLEFSVKTARKALKN